MACEIHVDRSLRFEPYLNAVKPQAVDARCLYIIYVYIYKSFLNIIKIGNAKDTGGKEAKTKPKMLKLC